MYLYLRYISKVSSPTLLISECILDISASHAQITENVEPCRKRDSARPWSAKSLRLPAPPPRPPPRPPPPCPRPPPLSPPPRPPPPAPLPPRPTERPCMAVAALATTTSPPPPGCWFALPLERPRPRPRNASLEDILIHGTGCQSEYH